MKSRSLISLKEGLGLSLRSDASFPLGFGEMSHREYYSSKKMNSASHISLGEDTEFQIECSLNQHLNRCEEDLSRGPKVKPGSDSRPPWKL